MNRAPVIERKDLSTKELARALGVSESSIKRWANAGTIRAYRTPGGHRRIPAAEALRFARAAAVPVQRPELLGDASGTSAVSVASPAELGRCLIAGRTADIDAVLGGRSGPELAAIFDELVQPALATADGADPHNAGPGERLGRRRLHESLVSALQRLRGRLPQPPVESTNGNGNGHNHRTRAWVGAAVGDDGRGWSLMAALTYESAGRRAVELGADVPFDELLLADAQESAEGLWLAVGSPREAARLTEQLPRWVELLGDRRRALTLVGPHAAGIAAARAMGLTIATSFRELV